MLLYSSSLFGIDGKGSVMSNSVNRTFNYHAPGSNVAPNLPVVIIMHGDGGTGAGIKAGTGFDAVSDAKNFLAVYPDAINGDWNRYADDVPGDACTGSDNPNDDVKFISDLIDYLCSTYQININKVYATGHSAGGFMAYNLAIQLTNKIAAFAPVSATLCGDDKFMGAALAVNPPIPIYHIHGDADRDSNGVDYPDKDLTANYEWPLSFFSAANCKQDSYYASTQIVGGVIQHTYCSAPKPIYLVQIKGMGHVWPNFAGYNAEEAIVSFFLSFSLQLTSSCSTNSIADQNQSEIFSIKSISSGQFEISSSESINNLKVFDVLGNEIAFSSLQNNLFQLQNAVPGIYIIKATNDAKDVFVKKIIVQ